MPLSALRERIRRSRFSQAALARALRIDPSLLSRRLSGRRRWPCGFDREVVAALERLEAADAAARSAREAVLRAPSNGTRPPAAPARGARA